MSAGVMYLASPSSSPRSPRSIHNYTAHTVWTESTPPTFSSTTYGITPKMGFAPASPTISPAWLEAYRQLSFGFGSSGSAMGYGANIPDPVSQRVQNGNAYSPPSFSSAASSTSGLSTDSHHVHEKRDFPVKMTPFSSEEINITSSTDATATTGTTATTVAETTPLLTDPPPPEHVKSPPSLRNMTLVKEITPATTDGTSTDLEVETPSPSVLCSPTRKRLSWADNSGRMLEECMAFMRDDEPWRCSKTSSGFRRSPIMTPCPSPTRGGGNSSSNSNGMLTFLDSLPETQADLMVALGRNGAQLESVLVRAPLVFCTIRVMNVAFEKSVSVRVTGDDWKTYTDVDASYFPGSSDGRSDRFYATLSVPNYSTSPGLQFAVRMTANGREYWDSNAGRNYRVGMALRD